MSKPEVVLSEPEDESPFDVILARVVDLARSSKTEDRIYLSALAQVQLLREKNAKYKDAWKHFGILGCVMDLIKKFQRLEGLTWDRERKEFLMSAEEILSDFASEGSVYDTIRDICGYAILMLTLFDGASGWQLDNSLKALKPLLGESA
jgi:hypothetical protein